MLKFKKQFFTCNILWEIKTPYFIEKEKILVTAKYFKSRIPEKIDFGFGISPIRNLLSHVNRENTKFSHKKGPEKETLLGKIFAELIENILKKA